MEPRSWKMMKLHKWKQYFCGIAANWSLSRQSFYDFMQYLKQLLVSRGREYTFPQETIPSSLVATAPSETAPLGSQTLVVWLKDRVLKHHPISILMYPDSWNFTLSIIIIVTEFIIRSCYDSQDSFHILRRPTQHLQILDTWQIMAGLELLKRWLMKELTPSLQALRHRCDPRLRYWWSELPCSIQRYTVYRMFSTKVPVTRVSISRFHRFFFGGWHGCPNLMKIGFQTTSLCASQPWLWQVIELQPNLHHFQKWSTRRCFSNVCYCYFSYLIIYYTLRHAYLSHACFRKHHNKPGVGGFVNFSPFLNQIHSLSQLDMARKSSPNLLRVQETARSDLKDLRFLDQCLDRPHCMSVGWHHKGKL